MKANIKSVIPLFSLLAISMLLVQGCRKQDEIYKKYIENGEIVYSGRVDSVMVYPGLNRVKLSWLRSSDRKVNKIRIFWDDKADSLELPVKHGEGMAVDSVTIDKLTEGLHTFQLITYDDEGNSSMKVTVEGRAYGDKYMDALGTRTISKIEYLDEVLIISWLKASDEAKGAELVYTDSEGMIRTLQLPADQQSISILNYKFGTSLRFRDKYLPDQYSIDVFYSAYSEVTPKLKHYLDTELNRSKFSEFKLPGDALPWVATGNFMSNLWSGITAGNQEQKAWYRTNTGSGIPHHFQFDIGRLVRLSRFKIWQRGIVNEPSIVYANGNLRKWEVWGAAQPSPDGSYEGWVKLKSCESIKPSGLPLGNNSSEDLGYAALGESFEMEDLTTKVRYIRIKVIQTWANVDFMHASEIRLWGDYSDIDN